MNPRYPVYIVSKGRWQQERRLTVRCFERFQVPYRIVVEPQEYESYAAVVRPENILTLPFSNLGQGSIPARNWVWERAREESAERYWIVDDNIGTFYRLNRNLKVQVTSGTIFRAMEDFADRYENVALAGPHYEMFAPRKAKCPPLTLNSRVYSCILVKSDIPYRWRGRYNEDTDLALRALKDGWCTVLFLAFLADKRPTLTMLGGNTDALYQGDGRQKMAESLQAQHPDVVKIIWKWGRWQHQVDYRPFKKNRLVPRRGIAIGEGINNYGMSLRVDDGGASRGD